ncbi:hypothetical protein BV898_08849 [Hypsibius exemplaris]|uniref:Uncharacterized protein n=1 Tax=Hypsibius exemplaris TaxID=2072580 RepID=A0A1W0WP49_HYPEX|nr:hypothetical protein BV898_08849 [Hypsibius exemplaris]
MEAVSLYIRKLHQSAASLDLILTTKSEFFIFWKGGLICHYLTEPGWKLDLILPSPSFGTSARTCRE